MARDDITEKQKLFLIALQDDILSFRRRGRHNTYGYSSLDPLKTEIRLVTVLPGMWEDRIQCEISVASLKANPEYEALSYSWGNPELKEPIWVGDKQIGVTSNCLKALRRFRSREQPVTLWIDAICINQSDDGEKSWQVKLMGEIYEKTERVLIWLGEND
ncbi:HET-domain-containing protein, partial [Cadophora sp. DSE1049]